MSLTRRRKELPEDPAPRSLSFLGLRRAALWAALDVSLVLLLIWYALLFYSFFTRTHIGDFGRFYYSVQSFWDGQDMYGETVGTISSNGQKHFWNLNPPHFHLAILPLSFLGPTSAFVVWTVLGLLSLGMCLWWIISEADLGWSPRSFRVGLLVVLAFVSTRRSLALGQVSLLLTLPITLAWLNARRGRWTRGGIWLGLALSVKPFLGLFLPFLILRKQFRAFLTAAAVASILFALGIAFFGVQSYRSWLAMIPLIDWAPRVTNVSFLGFMLRLMAYPAEVLLAELPYSFKAIWFGVSGTVALLTLAVSCLGSTAKDIDRSFGVLLLGALLISPLGWTHYLWIAAGPVYFMLKHWWNESQGRFGWRSLADWRWRLVLLALPGLFFPAEAGNVFQLSEQWEVWIGAVFTLTVAGLWGAMIVDGWRHSRAAEGER